MASGGTVYGAVLRTGTSTLITNAVVQSNKSELAVAYGNGAYSGSTSINNEYILTASAPGYQPNNTTVVLTGGGIVSRNIFLTPS